MRQARCDWQQGQARLDASHLVFLDETWTSTCMTPLRGWAPRGERCESIEVPASHLGLGVNPLVLWVVADRLAQLPEAWQPFEHAGWRRVLYRNPHLENLFGG